MLPVEFVSGKKGGCMYSSVFLTHARAVPEMFHLPFFLSFLYNFLFSSTFFFFFFNRLLDFVSSSSIKEKNLYFFKEHFYRFLHFRLRVAGFCPRSVLSFRPFPEIRPPLVSPKAGQPTTQITYMGCPLGSTGGLTDCARIELNERRN